MKIKPTSKSGGVLVELSPKERQIPGVLTTPIFTPSPAFRLNRILVPVDFSECSDKALEYALSFAREFKAELTLLHVLQPCPPAAEMYPMPVGSLSQSQADLDALREMVGSSVRCKTLVRSGTPHAQIVNAAKELEIDLIIISTHGHTGVTRAILGSTTEQVVRRAPCPVLVVRREEHEFIRG
jgi:nucleotide-binding universal stress UspA family protein